MGVTAHTINGENADYANIGPRVALDPNRRSARPVVARLRFWVLAVLLTIRTGSAITSGRPSCLEIRLRPATIARTAPRSGPAYGGFTGTSAATPQVAAVAALIKSMIPGASPAQINGYIINNLRPHPVGGACALHLLWDLRDSAAPGCLMPTRPYAQPFRLRLQ